MNILVLCTYPVKNPTHGGQLRVRNIIDAYTDNKYDVQVAGVLGSETYEPEDGFVPYPGNNQLLSIIKNPFLMEDYAIGKLFSNDEKYFKSLVREIKTTPDIIHVEQPWLIGFAVIFSQKYAPLARIIYGSQNIEWMLKKEILSNNFNSSDVEASVKLIHEAEEFAIMKSHAITCVSENDFQWIRSRTEKPILIARNGVKDWSVTKQGEKEAAVISRNYRYALYCASGHPPNVEGFFQIFGGGFGSLKPDEKIIIAGGAGWSIAGDKRVHKSAKLAEKIIIAGIVNSQCLAGLIDKAHCLVLPLTQGGGTNLKTAEALWSRKHIVATPTAMRGFEPYIDAAGVNVAEDSITFKRKLRNVMGTPSLELTEDEVIKRQDVLWGSCLANLPTVISAIVNNREFS
ncbi:MAG: glycosyltransferase [Comamonas sp.]